MSGLGKPASGFQHDLCRVSVIGKGGDWKAKPPPIKERSPDRLIQAWVWTLLNAITIAPDKVRARIPHTNLAGRRPDKVAGAKIRELRTVRDQAHSHGEILSADDGARENNFLFLEGGNKLREVSINVDSGVETAAPALTIDAWERPEQLYAKQTAGATFLGGRTLTTLWYGLRGQSTAATSLPYPLQSWTPASDRMLVGLDEKGTLHVLRFALGKWEATDYQQSFIPVGAPTACTMMGTTFVAHDGDNVRAIGISDKGKLEAKETVAIGVKFDGPGGIVNEQGYVAALKADGTLVFGREQSHALGAVLADAERPYALARAAPVVAWINAEKRLTAATISGTKVALASPTDSILLDEIPDSLVWNRAGTFLVATFPSGRCIWAQRFGFT